MKLSEVEVLHVVTVVVDAASVISCTWLLWKVPAANRRFLLPKQIVNLALADVLFSSMNAAIASMNAAGLLWMVLVYVEMMSFLASLLLEVHISVGFFALYWRKPTLVMFLKRTVWLTWVIATFMVIVTDFIYLKWGYAGLLEFNFFATLSAFVITAVMYIAVWFRSCFSPLRGEQRALRMLSLYPATFLLTWVPLYVCFLHNNLTWAGPFVALNGVLNVLLYSCHTRFSGSVWRDMEEEGGVSVAQWGGRSARPVGFSMSAVLEVHVPAVQRMALEESEREIADIESSRADLPGEQ